MRCEEAWRWLTEQDLLRRWLGEAEAEAGDRGRLSIGAWGGREGPPAAGRTREFTPPTRWVLTFGEASWTAATDLEIELIPRPGGCEVSVLQRGFERLPLSTCLTVWEAYRRRWRAALDRLAATAGRPPV
jgi:uncharacterized protein YndB with AHSA1/START domain